MKRITSLYWVIFLLLPLLAFQCNVEDEIPPYKGKLAVAGMCGNYTIVLLEGNLPASAYESTWVDPQTGISYSKAFRLANICDFPSSVQEGDEFYFYIENRPNNQCANCLAFYPTPQRALAIRVHQ